MTLGILAQPEPTGELFVCEGGGQFEVSVCINCGASGSDLPTPGWHLDPGTGDYRCECRGRR